MSEEQLPPAASPASTQTLKSVTEFRRHQVVQDRVDGGVCVLHDAREVKETVVPFHAQDLNGVGKDDDPDGEDSEGKQTDEEGQDDSS